jgi:hypothetical protein
MPLKNVLSSLLVALPLDFMINAIKSIERRERLRILLYARILMFLARRPRENMRRRVGNTSSLAKLIINVKSPLSKECDALTRVPQVMSELIWRSARPGNVA